MNTLPIEDYQELMKTKELLELQLIEKNSQLGSSLYLAFEQIRRSPLSANQNQINLLDQYDFYFKKKDDIGKY